MEKSKKIKRIVIILAAVLILGAGALVWLFASQGTQLHKADGQYSFSNPTQIKAEPDAGFVIDEDSPEDIMDVFAATDDGDGYDE